MLETIGIVQFFELKAWYEMEPRGQARRDLHEARLLHLLYNVNVAKKDQKSLEEFVLKFHGDETQRIDSHQQMLAANTAAVMAMKLMAETGMLN